MLEGIVVNLGRMAYRPCTELQNRILTQVAGGALPDTLLFVQHDPVLTLGANFHLENLLLSRNEYASMGIAIEETGRGGDVTYHGPGQLVLYPIFDVAKHGKDLHRWLRDLEETMILTLEHFGLSGYRFSPNTGIWVAERKIAAIGIKVSRWVSMHGIALNCSNDLSPFDEIVPCGIEGYGVTSLSEELARTVEVEEASPVVRQAFEQVFGLSFQQQTVPELMAVLG